jgi:hypothetical protein
VRIVERVKAMTENFMVAVEHESLPSDTTGSTARIRERYNRCGVPARRLRESLSGIITSCSMSFSPATNLGKF